MTQQLTPRDLELFRAYARRGGSWREAGADVHMAESTAKTHAKRVYRVLGTDGILGAFQKLGWLVPK